ncbi:hypothetical protein PF001_g30259 [Phytophthora fragariae]|uniref:Uncharacterized protein n=1 Tax=Phytophthora fragariae TaxID=53985 RepID=A0A6A4B618_9STRA|nr:hypothetical protein PF001_g30259 [Phytophthora fragariae]
MRTPDEGDTNSSAARTAAESAAESILAEMEEAGGSGQPASTTAATAGSSDEADRAHTAEEDHASKPRKGLTRQQLLVSGGRTVAARRRQRRTEQELATLQSILMPELRERRAERAKVLRLIVKTLIAEVNTAVDAGGKKQRQRRVQAVVAEARQVELAAMNQGRSDGKDAPQTVARKKTRRDESRATATAATEKNKTEDEWFECMRQYALELPEELVEEGTLAEMRAARRSAAKAVKRYKIARRGYRLHRRRRMMDRVRATEAAKPVQQRRRIKRGYHYERQGHYGDVELVLDAKGKPLRTAQLRATGASSPSCLPTALLALSKAHTQEVRLDSCAQFSVAGRDLRKYGRCITRNAPVDVVLGFGGGQTRVLRGVALYGHYGVPTAHHGGCPSRGWPR